MKLIPLKYEVGSNPIFIIGSTGCMIISQIQDEDTLWVLVMARLLVPRRKLPREEICHREKTATTKTATRGNRHEVELPRRKLP